MPTQITGELFLDWAIMSVSLFNTIVLLWLGLMVLLNADDRRPGILMASGSLLLAGAFFVSHSAILGLGLRSVGRGINFWWLVGWVPVIALPFAWYAVTLWYAGFWERGAHSVRRHRPWFALSALAAVTVVTLLLLDNPLPPYINIVQLNLPGIPAANGVPLIALFYPLYAVLCMGLSLDVLRRPAPSGRLMGDAARRKARPWLAATSFTLLLVSLLVGWAMLWIALNAHQTSLSFISEGMERNVALFDLAISSLIAVANVLLGQAIVSYEIFTGKTLPRKGFLRQWRNAVILAVGYSGVVAFTLTYSLLPIHALLLTTLLMTTFYALFGWRTYAERERYIEHLRPFVTSPRVYDYLLTPGNPATHDVDAETPFRALCSDVLGTRLAFLVAVGPLSPLVGPPLIYVAGNPSEKSKVSSLKSQVSSFDLRLETLDLRLGMCLPVSPFRYAGAEWAVPLWSERGLIGVLLLGPKRDGGLYTQEEIEIARASGERLIDTRASAAMAQRLMLLQRRRLAESQVIDRRARRVLHDDVLPRLHTAMLGLTQGSGVRGMSVSGGRSAGSDRRDAVELLGEVHRQISDLLHEMPSGAAPEVARMGLAGALKMALDEELGSAFDGVAWEAEPEAVERAGAIPPLTAEVLYYAAREAVRNAARHGRNPQEPRPLHLRVSISWRDGLCLAIEDDGVGMDAALASNEDGGSGQGLALHSTMMAVVGGSLATESMPGRYTRVVLSLPQGSW